MEFLQLRYFLESAKWESFAKTAEIFMVPATSVSASVKRLEEEIGCKLFDRAANRIHLNENGRLLEKSLQSSFEELSRTVEELRFRSGQEREIRILVRSMRRKLTERIVSYRKSNPRVPFQIVFDFGERDWSEYDLIIDEKKETYAGYEGFELFNIPLRLKCASSNPLCGNKLRLSDLAGHSFVSMGEEGNMHRILLSSCQRAGFTPEFSVICNDIECFEKMVASGMGIGIGREEGEVKEGVCDLSVSDFHETYRVWVYYRKKESFQSLMSFLDFLKPKSLAE